MVFEGGSNIELLSIVDPQIARAIEAEKRRQQEKIELIASEMPEKQCQKHRDLYLPINMLKDIPPPLLWRVSMSISLRNWRGKEQLNFKAEHVTQPHSGASANMVVHFAVLETGDTALVWTWRMGAFNTGVP